MGVADRPHHLRVYEQCFVGAEAVEWLVRAGEAESAEAAVALGNRMLRERIIYHVLNEHPFENSHLFYRCAGALGGAPVAGHSDPARRAPVRGAARA